MASYPSASSDTPVEKAERRENLGDEKLGTTLQYEEPTALTLAESDNPQDRGRFQLRRAYREGQEPDWWFASTAIPLLAATLGPLANVLSIAALVSYWRETVHIDGAFVADFDGVSFRDPRWCYWLNVASLVAGFLGNLFLLLNFTQRIRYIIALPASIILWYFSTGTLIGITICMEIYAPPNRPYETYTQGFWYAVAAAAFYLICSMILMVNMLGYFLGHYPDTFALTDAQRTLILQTMLFFIWLAGGAAVFQRIENDAGESEWDFADALYFCDVTILTVGFGDLYPTSDLGRGIIFPYSVGGIISLGLVISSIYKFMRQLGEENIIQKHVSRMRERTIDRTVSNSFDLREREHNAKRLLRRRGRQEIKKEGISAPTEVRKFNTVNPPAPASAMPSKRRKKPKVIRFPLVVAKALRHNPRILLLRSPQDRFQAMRHIQFSSSKFKKWSALLASTTITLLLWFLGALTFYMAENPSHQSLSYFQALYFCYVSLITIGYGDMSPKSNAGRCFFVVWSLIAVPTMTILVGDLSDTVVEGIKRGSSGIADFTVLPKEGIWRAWLERHPWILRWIVRRRAKRGFSVDDPEAPVDGVGEDITLEIEGADVVIQDRTDASLGHNIALAIRRVASDMRHTAPDPKQYCYEEWLEFTRLLKAARRSGRVPRNQAEREMEDAEDEVEAEEEAEALLDWDWLGEDSPLASGISEAEWLLDRLTDALLRVERARARARATGLSHAGSESGGRTDGELGDGGTVGIGLADARDVGGLGNSGQQGGDEIQRSQVLASGGSGPATERQEHWKTKSIT